MIWLFLSLVAFGLAYDWITTFWLARWIGPKIPSLPTHLPITPATFFRPIKPGVPDLENKLRTFLSSLQPDDQVLIGIYHDDSVSRTLAHVALAAFPELDATLISCHRAAAKNPKINKLIQLTPWARHDHWIVMDSEIANADIFLPQFRQQWSDLAHAPILSAPYRFLRLTLTTFPVLHTLLPGLAVLHRFGKIRNTLGAVLALTRGHVAQLGGWESLGDQLAEDYQIGHRLSALGFPVAYSWAVVELDNDPATQHPLPTLHRISVTYRICQPWGFAGSLLTLSTFWSLLLFPHWQLAVPALLFASFSRILASRLRALRIGWHPFFGEMILLYPVSALLEIFFWFLAWLPLPVHWAGRRWKGSRRANSGQNLQLQE